MDREWTVLEFHPDYRPNFDTSIVNPSFMTSEWDHRVQLVVSDGSLDSDPVFVDIPEDTPVDPSIDLDEPEVQVSVGDTVYLDVFARSYNGETLRYLWSIERAPATSEATITQADEPFGQIVPDVPGTYVIEIKVDSAETDFVATKIKTILVRGPGNIAPVASAASLDAEGDPLVYKWRLSTPFGSSAVLDDPSAIAPRFSADVKGRYFVALVVSDGQQNSEDAEITIFASGSTPNTPPVSNAGADITAVVFERVLLSGSASSDADGDPLEYAWERVSRPANSNARLDPDQETYQNTEFYPDVEGTYEFELTVSDWETSSRDTVVLTVGPRNTAPVADSGQPFRSNRQYRRRR